MHSRQARERALLFCLSSGGGGLVAKSCPTLATPWTVACQALLSMRFSRQEYWSGLPCPCLSGSLIYTISSWKKVSPAHRQMVMVQIKNTDVNVNFLHLLLPVLFAKEKLDTEGPLSLCSNCLILDNLRILDTSVAKSNGNGGRKLGIIMWKDGRGPQKQCTKMAPGRKYMRISATFVPSRPWGPSSCKLF